MNFSLQRVTAILAQIIGTIPIFFFSSSTLFASDYDFLPQGTSYCADSYTTPSIHLNYFGGSDASKVVDLNFPNDEGTVIRSPETGFVTISSVNGVETIGWGNSIVWENLSGTEKFHLAHLNSFLNTGVVAAGDGIGTIGGTPHWSPHLHVSRAQNDVPSIVVLSGQSLSPAFPPDSSYGTWPCYGGITYSSYGNGSDFSCVDALEPFSTSFFNPFPIANSSDRLDAKICSGSDIDYYRINLSEAGSILVQLEPPFGANYFVSIFDSEQNYVSSSGSSIPGLIQISAPASSGHYFIKVEGVGGSHNATQNYRIRAYFGPSCYSIQSSKITNSLSSNTQRKNPSLPNATSSCGVPQIPTSVAASDGSYIDKVRVTWTQVSVADTYRVYRCSGSQVSSCGSYFSKSAPPFDDAGAVAGVQYYYRVSACNSNGCSELSSADSGFRQSASTNLPQINISASPSTITSGSSTTISWSTSNAASCSASGAWSGPKSLSGSEPVFPGGTTTYTLTCSGPGGSASNSTTVTVTGVAQPPIVLIEASAPVVTSGSLVYLVWASGGSTSCQASGGWSGTQALSGIHPLNPTSTKTYTITCTGPGGSDSDSVTISVGSPDPVSLEAAPSTIYDGDSSTLYWSTNGMSSCQASGGWSGSKSLSGSQSVSPSSNRTYVLTCTESGGSVSELVQNGAFSGTTSQWTKTGHFRADSFFETNCKSCPGYAYLTGSAGTLVSSNNLEGELYQAVSIPANASSASLEFWFSVSTLESGLVDYDHLYITIKNSSGGHLANVLTVSNVGAVASYQKITWNVSQYKGQTIRIHFRGKTDATNGTIFRIDDVSVKATVPITESDSATVTVIDPPSPTLSFNAEPDQINIGGSSILTWSSTDTDSCNASGGWSGSKGLSGSTSVSPSTSTTYTLACTGPGGTKTRNETVVVVQPQPTVQISANPLTVDSGNSSQLSWSTTNATACTALGEWSGDGSKPTSGSLLVYPASSATYGLSCSGLGGTAEASVTVSVNPPVGPEIEVLGNLLVITDGDLSAAPEDFTHFGSVDPASGPFIRTFVVRNIGNEPLLLTGTPLVSLSGLHPADFAVTYVPTTPIGVSQEVVFQVSFIPRGNDVRKAEISISNNDGNENPYNFAIEGIGINVQPCRQLTRSHTGQGSDPVAIPGSSTGCSAGQYHAGEVIGLTATPDAGWAVSGWTGTDNNGSTSTSNQVTMPASAHAVSVTYEELPETCYALSRSHSGQGSDPVATPGNSNGCSAGQYHAGEVIGLTATPDAGWMVSGWTGADNIGSTSTSNQVTMPASAHAVSVTYEELSETCYSLSRGHTGQGSDPVATPGNSIGCSAGQYHAGEIIGLVATPDSGWTVASWTGTDNNGSTSTSNQVTMPASAHAVSVTYEELPAPCYSLSRGHTGQGSDPVATPGNSIGCSAGEYHAGEIIGLVATPDSGWTVASWTGADNDGSTSTSNQVTMPASAHAVMVSYATSVESIFKDGFEGENLQLWVGVGDLSNNSAQRFRAYGEPEIVVQGEFNTYGQPYLLARVGNDLISGKFTISTISLYKWNALTGDFIGPLAVSSPIESHLETTALASIGVSTAGELLIAPSGFAQEQRSIAMYSSNGDFIRTFTSSYLQHIHGTPAADNMAIYVASRYYSRGQWNENILMWEKGGTFVGELEVDGAVGDVAIMDGKLFVLAYDTGIRVFNLNGASLPTYSHFISLPPDVNPSSALLEPIAAMAGYLFVGDSRDQMVYQLSLDGQIVDTFSPMVTDEYDFIWGMAGIEN